MPASRDRFPLERQDPHLDLGDIAIGLANELKKLGNHVEPFPVDQEWYAESMQHQSVNAAIRYRAREEMLKGASSSPARCEELELFTMASAANNAGAATAAGSVDNRLPGPLLDVMKFFVFGEGNDPVGSVGRRPGTFGG